MRSAILKIVVGCMIGFHTDALAIGPLCAVTPSLVSVSSCNNARLDDDEDTAETTTFFNLSLRELTGADSNRDLIEYVQTMEHREDAGEFLRDSFGGNEETARLGQLIWDARSRPR